MAVVLLAVAVCFRFYADIILHPGAFLFGAEGDGLKNYFTVAYQVIHGHGLWFNGMLYPYGDHQIYADGQPLLTKVLSWFIGPEVNNGPQVIAAMNLLMIGSIVITAWCVHRLLVWNMVNPWFAVPFSLVIAFLSPQMARFTGHYALAYTCFVPITWLLTSAIYHKHRVWAWTGLFVIFSILFGFIQPYYLFISTVFIGAVFTWEIIVKGFRLRSIDRLLPKVSALVLPIAVFLLYQKSVDIYSDRPGFPGGTYAFLATFQSVFVPVSDPFKNLFNSYFFRIFTPSSWEGNAFIGFVASFTALVSLYSVALRWRKRKWRMLKNPVLPDTLKTVFIPGILTLLLAMGVFHHLGLEWLSNFITPIKQFRSLGRIAWIFYYIFSVWTVYHLWALYRYLRSVHGGKLSYLAKVLILLCLFVWTLDAIVNIKSNKEGMIANRNAAESFSDHYARTWQDAGVNLDEYQAILPLPFSLIGSEKIGLEGGSLSITHAFRAAFSTGLPLLGGTMSRTSAKVTENSAQLMGNALLPRRILDNMDPEKKILVLRTYETLATEENRLIGVSEPLYSNDEYGLFALPLDSIRSMCRQYRLQALAQADSMPNADYSLRPSQYQRTIGDLWGSPAYSIAKEQSVIDSTFSKNDSLIISFWLKMDPKTELTPHIMVTLAESPPYHKSIGNNPNLLDGWLLVSDTVSVNQGTRLTCKLTGHNGTISRMTIRRTGRNTVHQESGITFLNNIPLIR